MYTIGGVMMHKDRNGNMLIHSAKGQEWDHHKYVDKVKGKDGKWHYIYNTSKSPISPTMNEIKQLKSEGVEFDYSAVKGTSNSKLKVPEVTNEDFEQVEDVVKDILEKRSVSGYISDRVMNSLKEILRRAISGELDNKETGSRNKSSRRA